jgi:two-component system OmpR family response regulator
MKIFIVEDSPDIRERLRALIGDIANAEIIGEADNQEDALRSIFQSAPDVVIVDLHLAGGSGMSTLQQIKQKRPEIKVIVLTNHGYPQYRKRCMELGADCFLDKCRDIKTLPGILLTLFAGLLTAEQILG